MCRSNFRVKLDLCKFFNDVRRYCWIFVDGTKMLRIAHAMEHIAKLFSIADSFHLLLNETEYLPPDEDIRVLKENETILVRPGTGIEGEKKLASIIIDEPEAQPMEIEKNVARVDANNPVVNKESQTNFQSEYSDPVIVEKSEINCGNRSESDVMETNTANEKTEDEANSTIDSKENSILLGLNLDTNTPPRRKRVRTRRKKSKEVKDPPVTEANSRKPKIINSYVISTAKHIRFDNLESAENVAKQITQSQKMNGPYANDIAPPHELANLLSLGQNSTPVTFAHPQVKDEIKLESMSDEESRSSVLVENKTEKNELTQAGKELLAKELENCPALTTKPKLKSTIAFKMLKIGEHYTPQVSEFIVAEVISYCPKTSLYTLKLKQGFSEIQVPVGKFTLMDDEEEQTINDTITINIAQLIEPRIVSYG